MEAVADLAKLLKDAPLPLIAARARRARRAKGWSHDTLGERMGGVYRQNLIKLEQGRHRPRMETLLKLAEATDRDPEWFVDPEVDPSPFPGESTGAERGAA